MRKTLIISGAVLALLLLLLVLLPVLFGGRIAERVKTEANRSLNARVDWRDAGLSLFGDFPNLTLSLDGLTVVGVGKFEGDTLAAIRRLGVVLDLASAVRSALGGSGPVVIRAIELDHPRLSLVKLKDGSANWDITKPDTTAAAPADTAAGRAMAISLRRFDIDSGVVAVDNQAGNLRASVVGFDQSLAGDFGAEQLTIETRAHADEVSLEFAGIPYLRKVRLDASTDVAADLAKKSFTLKESAVRLNELTLGSPAASPRSATGSHSTWPSARRRPSSSTSSRSSRRCMPATSRRCRPPARSRCRARSRASTPRVPSPRFRSGQGWMNGTFRYPDLPLPARDIGLDLAITNPGGDADSTTVNLRRFHVVLGQNPVDAVLVVRTPISDPDVDARVAGKVDLGDLRRTMKLEGVQELAGTVAADAAVRTRMSWLDSANPQYDRIAARGTVDRRPPHGEVRLAPPPAEYPGGISYPSRRRARSCAPSTPPSAAAICASPAGWTTCSASRCRDEVLRGSATLASKRFDLNEWRSDEGELSVIPVPANLDFGFDATVNEVLYDNLTLRNARGRLRVKDQRITLQDFTFNTLGGGFALNGFYETKDVAKPTFDVGIKIQKLDLPQAFEAFTTVKMLAPVAKYARGTFSTDLKLSGALGKDMMPLFPLAQRAGRRADLDPPAAGLPAAGQGGEPDQALAAGGPGLQGGEVAVAIQDGRLKVQPFDVGSGRRRCGCRAPWVDQSIDYDLSLKVPRSLLGAEANQAISFAGVEGRRRRDQP